MSFPKHFKQGTVKRPRDCRLEGYGRRAEIYGLFVHLTRTRNLLHKPRGRTVKTLSTRTLAELAH